MKYSALCAAIKEERCSSRVWLYSNYHCNLECRYCLTESSPSVPKRMLHQAQLIGLSQQCHQLGFAAMGITGGEPFLVPWMTDAAIEISKLLPVTILTNGTLFQGRLLHDVARLAGKNIAIQISIDSENVMENDRFRGERTFAKVVTAIPKLIDLGVHVRISSTLQNPTEKEKEQLANFLTLLGIQKEDQVIRHVVTRGRAELQGLGIDAPLEQLPPELTLSAMGAFYSPYGPTFQNGRLQTDLLLTRTIDPVSVPVQYMLRVLGQTEPVSAEEHSGFV